MPNPIAYAALLLWPFASMALFRALGPARGLIASLIGAYLLLPPVQANFDLPILPPLNRDTIPSFTALAICLWIRPPGLQLLPESRAARVLLAALLMGPVLTILTNVEPIFWGSVVVPGLRLVEVPSMILSQLAMVIPFLLARALLAGEADQRDLLRGFLVATLAYTLPMLVEVRLSPQVNTWVYGFFQHDFAQMMRGDGFRPIVFLYHGLWVALLAATAVLVACVLLRTARDVRRAVKLAFVGLWVMGVLILCKSLGSLVLTILFAPLILLGSARMQVRAAGVVALLVLAYPIARGADLVPVDGLVSLAQRASPERARSLEFRLNNEEILLEHARRKPVFGWGIWGRHQVRDEQTGEVISTTDGRWIIVLGVVGWVGFLGEFGLLALPLLTIWWRSGPAPPRLVAGLSVILAVNLADMLPNATLTPLTWLWAGALTGWAERRQVSPARAVRFPVLIGAADAAPLRTVL